MFDVQSDADAFRYPGPSLDENHVGVATIETWTVFFERDGAPRSGVVVARTPSGARTLARLTLEDCGALTSVAGAVSEPVGRSGQIVADGEFRFWQFQ